MAPKAIHCPQVLSAFSSLILPSYLQHLRGSLWREPKGLDWAVHKAAELRAGWQTVMGTERQSRVMPTPPSCERLSTVFRALDRAGGEEEAPRLFNSVRRTQGASWTWLKHPQTGAGG